MRKLQHFSLLLFLSFCFIALNAQAEEYGMASYYGDEFHGGATASGQSYDKNKLTAAHKTHPIGAMVRVTRLDNKKSVVVRINDRGPYLKGRIIDLSGRAASALDMISEGTVEVKIEVLDKKSKGKKETTKGVSTLVIPKVEVPAKEPKTVKKKSKNTPVTIPKVTPPSASTEPAKTQTKNKAVSKQETIKKEEEIQFELVTGKDYNEYDLYKIQIMRPEKKGFGVQVASFSDYSNAMKKVAELQGQWFKNILISIEKGKEGKPIYKLILGPFSDHTTASSYKKHAKKNKKIDGFVVSLENIKAAKN